MRNTKGFTVHFDVNGKSACGVTPRGFMGLSGLSKDPRRVTCSKCEKAALAARVALAATKGSTEAKESYEDSHAAPDWPGRIPTKG